MYKNKKVAVVVPAYNEETQIEGVVGTMPEYVDKIVIVDDCSSDRTIEVVEKSTLKAGKVVLLKHEQNKGVGAAITTGYEWARDADFDVAVVMAGDGQMDVADLPAVLDPVVDGTADYTKGNRLITGEAYRKIPKVRYFGNAVLSFLTKIASGYWHIADSQSGYTAINARALRAIDWSRMYRRYGQPNDLLVRLNVHGFRVTDVPINPVYHIGEKSGIRIHRVLFTISWLILRLFLWRMKEKYVIRDFHPLIFFYLFGFCFGCGFAGLSIRLFWVWYSAGHVPPITALATMFTFMSASLFTLFAMWFDMEHNRQR